MKRAIILGLLAVGVGGPAALAQTPPRRVVPDNVPRAAQSRPAQARPVPGDASPDARPAQNQPGVCCCRVWSHGWQYSWRPVNECSTQNGTCVTPDHC